tara:strand:+ start:170 stop:958 length:789 start_codon:yes stop_codon:yes gene_type:complete
MALEAADVLVVQKQSGNKENKKLTVQQLTEYVQSNPAVVLKGTANMTDAAAEPTNPQNGDLYINSATVSGAFAWTDGSDPYTGTINPQAQVVYITTVGWTIASTGGSGGGGGSGEVVAVQGTLPITVNSVNAAQPIVAVNSATTLTTGVNTSGVVTVATNADVAAGTVGVIPTALQLKATNDAVALLPTTAVSNVTGTNPIEVATGTTTPAISIKDSAVSQKGAVALISDSAVAATNATTATTPKYVADFYLNKNFSLLTDA